MAIYIGTKEEFKKHFGGFLKNYVNVITKEEKVKLNNICEFCGKQGELDAAHIRGAERSKIIDLILEEFKNPKSDSYIVDIDKFIENYKALHYPLYKSFHFLCKDCHRKYDRGEICFPGEKATTDIWEEDIILVPPKPIPTKPYGGIKPTITPIKPTPSEVTISPVVLAPTEIGDYKRRENEPVQNWVKRIFTRLYSEGFLTEHILNELKNEQYCKQAFGIQYSLLKDNDRELKDRCGHNRYWIRFRLGGKYYVCSQWWKDSFVLYEQKINLWLQQILKNK